MSKKISFANKFQVQTWIRWISAVTVIFSIAGGCKTPAELVTEADRDVDNILTEKWDEDFGQMVNYQIRDGVADVDEIMAEIPPSGVLSLAKVVEIATKYSREYQSRKESLYNSALSLSLTRHNYARQWFGTFDYSYSDPADSGGQSQNNRFSSEVGVDQQFINPAGIITNAGLSIDWTRFLSGDPYTTLSSVLSATVTAPLLGNVAGKQAWESLTQSERNVLYQIRNFNRYRQEFVVSTINSYYNVLQEWKSLEIARSSYESQLRSANQLMMEVAVGRRPQSDADRARQQLLQAQNSLVTTEQNYAQRLDSFKISLSLPTDADITLDPNELIALEEQGVSEPEYTVEDAIQMALERRLDLANTRDQLDDTRRSLILAAEGIGVQADITAGANASSREGTNRSDVSRIQFNEGTYTAGLGVDLPFDQMSERNNYRRALISMQAAQRGYDETIENIKLAIRQAYRNLIATSERYQIQLISVETANRRVEEQKLRMQYGSSTVIDLLDAEIDLVDAQNDLTSALVSHLNAKLSFFRDIGILAVRPDGMWEKKQDE